MRHQSGFSYVIVMFLVAVLSLVSLRALENTLTAERRAKEAELLSLGMAYRDAIKAYYADAQGTLKSYPDSIEALLLDTRGTKLRKHLRKRFRDPITGSKHWGLIYLDGDTEKIIGVYSLSTRKPIKRDGFPPDLGGFTNAATYSDWRFIFNAN